MRRIYVAECYTGDLFPYDMIRPSYETCVLKSSSGKIEIMSEGNISSSELSEAQVSVLSRPGLFAL